MRKLMIIGLLVIISVCSAPAVFGDSLWANGSRPQTTDVRSFRVGDLLTINIIEQSSANNQVDTKGTETNTFLMGPGAGKLTSLIPYMKGNAQNGYTGSGQTSRAGTLTARLTVTVTSIDDNGILEIEGNQKIKVNKDEQELHIKGQVRPQDVRSDNSVISSYIANADIEYKGTGSGESGQPGVISRFLAWLF